MPAFTSNSTLQFGAGDTNLHSHGLKDSLGVRSQNEAHKYLGGDNIFVTVAGKNSSEATPAEIEYKSKVPEFHLPGLYWYHPHKHGSTTFQVL
jgi:hypothetical protein